MKIYTKVLELLHARDRVYTFFPDTIEGMERAKLARKTDSNFHPLNKISQCTVYPPKQEKDMYPHAIYC